MSYTLFFIYPRHATVLKSSTNHYKSLTRHKCMNSFAQGMQKQNKYGNYEHFRGLLHRKNNLSKIALFTHFIILPFGSVGSISLTYNAVLQITILILQSSARRTKYIAKRNLNKTFIILLQYQTINRRINTEFNHAPNFYIAIV